MGYCVLLCDVFCLCLCGLGSSMGLRVLFVSYCVLLYGVSRLYVSFVCFTCVRISRVMDCVLLYDLYVVVHVCVDVSLICL